MLSRVGFSRKYFLAFRVIGRFLLFVCFWGLFWVLFDEIFGVLEGAFRFTFLENFLIGLFMFDLIGDVRVYFFITAEVEFSVIQLILFLLDFTLFLLLAFLKLFFVDWQGRRVLRRDVRWGGSGILLAFLSLIFFEALFFSLFTDGDTYFWSFTFRGI